MKATALLVAVLAAAPMPAFADVVIASATDTSASSPSDRGQNRATLRRTLARIASKLPAANAQVDATIVKLTVEQTRGVVVVSTRVRIAISDADGRILSVVTGNAKVEQPRPTRARHLAAIRADAVSVAVESMFDKVKTATAPTVPSWPHRTLADDVVALARSPRS